MNAERENESKPLIRERVREAGEGVIKDEAIEELLAGTYWSHDRRPTSVGTAHVFTRPVTLLESVRINPEDYHNHRHTIGITRPDGEPLLTYMVLLNVHYSDLLKLPNIESALGGRRQVIREDFSDAELNILDQVWLPTAEISTEPCSSEGSVNEQIATILRRLGLKNRTELLVLGLHEGFINLELERWCGPWPKLNPKQTDVLRLAHFSGPEVAETLAVPYAHVGKRIGECYAETGARTRGELILGALANGEFRLSELPAPSRRVQLNPMQCEMLSLIDQPRGVIVRKTGASAAAVKRRYAIIKERLGLTTREELAVYAFREGLVDNQIDSDLSNVFTARQREIVENFFEGTGRTANKLGISRRAMSGHILKAKGRAGVHTRSGLVIYGLRAGLIDPDVITPRA